MNTSERKHLRFDAISHREPNLSLYEQLIRAHGPIHLPPLPLPTHHKQFRGQHKIPVPRHDQIDSLCKYVESRNSNFMMPQDGELARSELSLGAAYDAYLKRAGGVLSAFRATSSMEDNTHSLFMQAYENCMKKAKPLKDENDEDSDIEATRARVQQWKHHLNQKKNKKKEKQKHSQSMNMPASLGPVVLKAKHAEHDFMGDASVNASSKNDEQFRFVLENIDALLQREAQLRQQALAEEQLELDEQRMKQNPPATEPTTRRVSFAVAKSNNELTLKPAKNPEVKKTTKSRGKLPSISVQSGAPPATRRNTTHRRSTHSSNNDATVDPNTLGARLKEHGASEGPVIVSEKDDDEDAELLDDGLYHHSLVTRILTMKVPHERTRHDINVLFASLRHLDAFRSMNPFLLRQLCSVLQFVSYEANRAVFVQGSVGTSWYVILKGSVAVKKSLADEGDDKTIQERLFDAKTITLSVLKAGHGFGDLALINDAPRSASIVTLERSDFIRIDRADYHRIVKVQHDQEVREKMTYLRRLTWFQDWSVETLKPLTTLGRRSLYSPGEILVHEGEPMETSSVYFLLRGVVEVYRYTKIPKHYPLTAQESAHLALDGRMPVLVATFKEGDVVNEACLLRSVAKNTIEDQEQYKSRVEIRVKRAVDTIAFSHYDAALRFRHCFKYVPLTYLMNEAQAWELYVKQREEKQRQKDKRQTLDALVRERFKDPLITYRQYAVAHDNTKLVTMEKWHNR